MSINRETIQNTAKNLRQIFPPTPLVRSDFLSQHYQADIYLKREDTTVVRSYKIRGAYNFIHTTLEKSDNKNPLFVCASAGNHAQGFAFSCAHFQISGVVFMPITTPAQKIDRTREFGKNFITIELVGDTFDQCNQAAQKFCEEKSGTFVPPFDHDWIVAGQGTVAAEISEQVPKTLDIILVPIGGGGLCSGIVSWYRDAADAPKIFGVEPEGAASLHESLRQNQRVKLEEITTFVDGASVAQIGEKPWEILSSYFSSADQIKKIPENRLCQTMIDFLHHDGLVLEPAGALAIDALQSFSHQEIKGKTIICIVSGSNFDFDRLPEVKERAAKYAGKKKYFIVPFPQRPGALRDFLQCLGPEDDITRFEYLKKSARNFGSVLLGIETKKPQNFISLMENMKKSGFSFRDVTNDEILADFLV